MDFDTRPDLVLITVSFVELSVSTTLLNLGLTSLLSNMSSNVNARSAIGALLTYVFPSNVLTTLQVSLPTKSIITYLILSNLDLSLLLLSDLLLARYTISPTTN